MFTLTVTEKGGSPKRLEFDKDEITIGRVPGNDIILPKGNVSKRHTRVVRQDGRFFVVDLKSTNGTYLNGRRITTPSVIRPGDKIYVGDFIVMVEMSDGVSAPGLQDDPDGDEGTTNLRAEQAQAAIRDAALAAQQPPEPPPMDRRPEVSAVEPLPLDEEPPESSPPPPRPMGPSPRAPLVTASGAPLGAAPGSIGSPRAPMLTQPLGSASAAAMSAAGLSSPSGGQNRPTQPPPSRSPLRAPSVPGIAGNRGPLPAPGPRAPSGPGAPIPPLGGASPNVPRPSSPPPAMSPPDPARRASASQLNPHPMAPPQMGPPPMAAPQMGPPPMAPPIAAPPPMAAPPPFAPFAPIQAPPSGAMEVEPEPESIEAEAAGNTPRPGPATVPPEALPAEAPAPAPPPMAAPPPVPVVIASSPAPVPSATAAAPEPSRSASVPGVATLNIPPAVVDAVLQQHKTAAPGEPTPVGQEFATLLAEIVAEATSKGISSTSDRVVDGPARAKIRTVVETAARAREQLPNGVTADRLIRDAVAELAGTGAFETALDEAEVTTVIVEANGRVFVGRGDAVGPSPFWFSSPEAVSRAVDRMLNSAGKSRGQANVTDVVLNDNVHLLAVFPPVSPSGPTVVVERPARPASLIDLAARNMLSAQAATVLGAALVARRNVIVSGPKGSGRSTLLGALIASAANTDRCLLVERVRELAPTLPNVTTITADGDWTKAIDLAMRLRPQRLALGDVSEAGAAALVASLGIGAEGLLAVADGPSPTLSLQRIATLASASGAITRDDALARLAQTRPLVVHVARLGDGTCRVVSIGDARPVDGGGVRIDETHTLRIEGVNSSGKIDATLVAVARS